MSVLSYLTVHMRDLGQRMIDDQAKGTIPVYFKRPNAFPQKCSYFKLTEHE